MFSTPETRQGLFCHVSLWDLWIWTMESVPLVRSCFFLHILECYFGKPMLQRRDGIKFNSRLTRRCCPSSEGSCWHDGVSSYCCFVNRTYPDADLFCSNSTQMSWIWWLWRTLESSGLLRAGSGFTVYSKSVWSDASASCSELAGSGAWLQPILSSPTSLSVFFLTSEDILVQTGTVYWKFCLFRTILCNRDDGRASSPCLDA